MSQKINVIMNCLLDDASFYKIKNILIGRLFLGFGNRFGVRRPFDGWLTDFILPDR